MRKTVSFMQWLTMLIFLLALSSIAHTQSRTWVSGVGDDTFPCSRTAPCKTFAGAISKTATGGEISVIDPGSYGTLTINKALTVDAAPARAGVPSWPPESVALPSTSPPAWRLTE